MPDYLKIADDFLANGDTAKAIEFAERYIIDGENKSKAFEIIGIANYRAKNMENSIEYLNKAVGANSKNGNAHYNLGLVYIFRKEWDKALEHTQKALLIDKKKYNYSFSLAVVYKNTNKIGEALRVCSEILQLTPNDQSTLILRASIYIGQKEYQLAIEDYKKLDLKKYSGTWIYNNIGFYYTKLEDWRRAKTALQFALEFDPTYPYALNNLGFVYYQEKNYDQSLKYINESLEFDSSNSYALKNRALVMIATNKFSQAISDLTLAKELGYSNLYDNEVDDLLDKYCK